MSCLRVNPCTGFEQFVCPRCKSFISIQRYINLLSDWVVCKTCGKSIHVPSLIDATSSKTPHTETRTIARKRSDGQISRSRVPVAGQLTIFGGLE